MCIYILVFNPMGKFSPQIPPRYYSFSFRFLSVIAASRVPSFMVTSPPLELELLAAAALLVMTRSVAVADLINENLSARRPGRRWTVAVALSFFRVMRCRFTSTVAGLRGRGTAFLLGGFSSLCSSASAFAFACSVNLVARP